MKFQYHRLLSNFQIDALQEDIKANIDQFGLHYSDLTYLRYGGLRSGRTLWLKHENADWQLLDTTVRARAVVKQCASEISASPTFGKCYIHKLLPGNRIFPHTDRLAYHSKVDRFHLYLDIPPKVEIDHFGPKIEPYSFIQFNHHQIHSYQNYSSSDLYFVVFDLFKA
jgi:hypothetical protein